MRPLRGRGRLSTIRLTIRDLWKLWRAGDIGFKVAEKPRAEGPSPGPGPEAVAIGIAAYMSAEQPNPDNSQLRLTKPLLA